jgi:hypothetical protein
MKLNNFKLTETKGSNALDKEFIADVDVETGLLWWKKTERKQIRRKYCGCWHFVENGEHTPGFQAEKLARAWEAQTGQET